MSLPDLNDAQTQSIEVHEAVQTLVDHGLGAYVNDLAVKLGITSRSTCTKWRNVHYGRTNDRRWGIWEATSLSSRMVDSVPFGARLTVANTAPVGDDLWLELGPGPYQGCFVLAKSGETIHCVDLATWSSLPGPIPTSAFKGQEYPDEGMFTEGYPGDKVCVLSASGDALWREVNIEMLFRNIGTSTVFEAQWGGSESFMDWVAYYSANVVLYSWLKHLLVIVRPTARWRTYLDGCCRGPSIADVIDAIGKAQGKECDWMFKNRQQLRILWEMVEFVTAFTFLRKYAHWTDTDCMRAATQKFARVEQRWASLSTPERAHELQSAIFCLEEAFDGQPVGAQISETLLDLLVSNDGCPIGDKDAMVLAWRWALQAPKAHLRAILGKVVERDSLNPLFEADAEFAKQVLTELGGQWIPGNFVYALGGHKGFGIDLASAEVYDPALRAWAPLPPMAAPRGGLAAAALGGRLYALGGYGGWFAVPLASAEVYDPALRAWAPLPPMAVRRGYLAAAALGGRLYALGGYAVPGGYLASAEVYDPALRAWAPLPPMAAPRGYLAAAALGGRLYALGGVSGGGDTLASAEVYDPALRAWAPLPPMAAPRACLAAAALGGRLYALGGGGGIDLASAEVYDPALRAWAPLPPMAAPREALAAAALGGRLYALGGFNGGAHLNSVELYNPELNTWEEQPPMLGARSGMAAAAVGATAVCSGEDAAEQRGRTQAEGGRCRQS